MNVWRSCWSKGRSIILPIAACNFRWFTLCCYFLAHRMRGNSKYFTWRAMVPTLPPHPRPAALDAYDKVMFRLPICLKTNSHHIILSPPLFPHHQIGIFSLNLFLQEYRHGKAQAIKWQTGNLTWGHLLDSTACSSWPLWRYHPCFLDSNHLKTWGTQKTQNVNASGTTKR